MAVVEPNYVDVDAGAVALDKAVVAVDLNRSFYSSAHKRYVLGRSRGKLDFVAFRMDTHLVNLNVAQFHSGCEGKILECEAHKVFSDALNADCLVRQSCCRLVNGRAQRNKERSAIRALSFGRQIFCFNRRKDAN